MPEPHLRAADSDRAAVATVLGEHMAAGRLTVAEYDERLSRAYAARTYGELAELTADLPSTHRPPAAQPVAHSYPARACGPVPGSWHGGQPIGAAWRSWLSTAVIVMTIWAVASIASTSFLYFWPIWVIGPWGAVLLARTLSGGNHDRYAHRRHRGWAQYR
jgi:Domain of unknown function (DUF1707)